MIFLKIFELIANLRKYFGGIYNVFNFIKQFSLIFQLNYFENSLQLLNFIFEFVLYFKNFYFLFA